ncbi:MAG: flagellar hook-basal body complex protein FliE [Anaerolineae bacterium]|nr:flagellar hook-basal body complex protein FliE [Anaerolineae bacterium]
MSITPLTSKITPLNVGETGSITNGSASNTAGKIESTFSDMLKNLEETQATSDSLLEKLSAGENVDLSQLMIATQQTDISFKTAMAIRDRVVEAYKEIMRMTV